MFSVVGLLNFNLTRFMFSDGEVRDHNSSDPDDPVEESEAVGQYGEQLGRQKTRKRKRNVNKKDMRKKKRNSGKEYTTKKGKVVSAKTFTNSLCMCKMNCNEKISNEERKLVFENFYKIGEFKAQNAYIVGLCKQNTPKKHRIRTGSRGPRGSSIKYFIQLQNDSINVCKKYFLDSFKISDGRLFRALKKVRNGAEPGSDMRGKQTPANKIDDRRVNGVRTHIESFPAHQSHYTRAHNPNKKYLQENLNIKLMYTLYVEYCNSKDEEPVSESFYRNVFNHEYNLDFHHPSKDTCVSCDIYKMKMETETDESKKKVSR